MGAQRIADRITDVRRRYSQTAIAVALGLPQSSVSARVRGEIEWRREELRTLAEHLGVPLEELITDYMSDDPPQEAGPEDADVPVARRADVVAEHLERPVEQVGARP